MSLIGSTGLVTDNNEFLIAKVKRYQRNKWLKDQDAKLDEIDRTYDDKGYEKVAVDLPYKHITKQQFLGFGITNLRMEYKNGLISTTSDMDLTTKDKITLQGDEEPLQIANIEPVVNSGNNNAALLWNDYEKYGLRIISLQ